MLKKIISGGQTGADQGALHGAKLAGLATGGTAPKGWKTEWGPAESLLLHYNLCQSQNSGYAPRTLENIIAADGTLIFGGLQSSGSALTLQLCEDRNKPCLFIPWSGRKFRPIATNSAYVLHTKLWIEREGIETLNVAGNRESKNPGIHVATKNFIVDLIAELKKEQ